MSESRKTKKITYSIKERGYQFNGENRDDIDVQAMIDFVNSPKTQELVEKGNIFGYYGHQVRELYGLNPPETVIIDGKQVYIQPALRTIYLKADNDGNITHQQEFLKTDAGEQAYRLYKANAGGFSTAFYAPYNAQGKRITQGYFGADLVFAPNYDTNRGNAMFDSLGVMFDSLDGGHTLGHQHRVELERSLLMMYDSMYAMQTLQDVADFNAHRAEQAEIALQKELKRKQWREQSLKREQERIKRENEAFLLDSMGFDEYLRHNQQIAENLKLVVDKDDKPSQSLIGKVSQKILKFGM